MTEKVEKRRRRGPIDVKNRADREELALTAGKFNRIVEKLRFSEVKNMARNCAIVLSFGLFLIGNIRDVDAKELRITYDRKKQILKIDSNAGTSQFVTCKDLDDFGSSIQGVDNVLFRRLEENEHRVRGINYTIQNIEVFRDSVLHDAEVSFLSLKNNGLIKSESLRAITPFEFVKLVTKMVQDRIQYDHLALQDSQEGKSAAESISKTPLDQIYLTFHKGVCRHYPALVEACSQILLEAIDFSFSGSLGVDEVDGGLEIQHAWNIWYLKLSNGVAISFSDPTWSRNEELSDLEALDGYHTSVVCALTQKMRISETELEEAYEQLIRCGVGERDNNIIRNQLPRLKADLLPQNFLKKIQVLPDELYIDGSVNKEIKGFLQKNKSYTSASELFSSEMQAAVISKYLDVFSRCPESKRELYSRAQDFLDFISSKNLFSRIDNSYLDLQKEKIAEYLLADYEITRRLFLQNLAHKSLKQNPEYKIRYINFLERRFPSEVSQAYQEWIRSSQLSGEVEMQIIAYNQCLTWMYANGLIDKVTCENAKSLIDQYELSRNQTPNNSESASIWLALKNLKKMLTNVI